MVKIVKENRFYFLLLSLFIIVGGIYLWQSDKVDAILFYSDNRSPFLNDVFTTVTHFGEAPAYFIIGILAFVVRFRYALLVALTGFVVMGVSFGMKSLFGIDRPLAFFTKENLLDKINFIDGVQLHSGATSFPSGHSMSAFALFSLLIFLLPTKKRYVFFFFSMALLVGISRIYLVQHFWPDVYVGGIVGAILAMLIYSFQARYPISATGWWDKSLRVKKKEMA
ncbi:MAG: phosphatase PAP2 family protein [Bacteroidetes bacterium]|nr:phosphatase PAP2 family protein [Bacteroidota bacterium]